MKLHEMVQGISKKEAVTLYKDSCHSIVAVHDGDTYCVDNYSVFDLESVEYYCIKYYKFDIIKLVESLRSCSEMDDVSSGLYNKDTFTSLKSCKYDLTSIFIGGKLK